MTLTAYTSAVLALLLAPGPTNTLMAVIGAQSGLGRAVRLLPAELLGYLTTILPLVYVGAELMARWPMAAVALKIVAAIWVMALAIRLWSRRGVTDAAGGVTARQVYLTTMLNPKALIFGLVLLPAANDPQFGTRLALFCMMVVSAAMAWGLAGMLTRTSSDNGARLVTVRRVASVWLAIVSLTMIAGVLRA